MYGKLIGRDRGSWRLTLGLLLAAACSPAAPRGSSLEAALPAFDSVFERCRQSVVNISASRGLPSEAINFSPRQRRLLQAVISSLGSGFVFEEPGRILTCASVLEEAEEISIVLASGRQLPARLVERWPQADLALLEIDPALSPPPLAAGDSAALQPGQWVASFGYPYGLSHSLTTGIISAVLPGADSRPEHGLVLFDGAVNPGCNGGPLVDETGSVVGANLVARQQPALGQAVPINDVRRLLQQPRSEGGGWLGLSIRAPLEEETGSADRRPAAVVSRVVADGPAGRAGVKPGDQILEMNGQPLRSLEQLLQAVSRLRPGDECALLVAGEGGRRRLLIVAGRRP